MLGDEGAPALAECTGCATTYHRACLRELGGCATAGCAEAVDTRRRRGALEVGPQGKAPGERPLGPAPWQPHPVLCLLGGLAGLGATALLLRAIQHDAVPRYWLRWVDVHLGWVDLWVILVPPFLGSLFVPAVCAFRNALVGARPAERRGRARG